MSDVNNQSQESIKTPPSRAKVRSKAASQSFGQHIIRIGIFVLILVLLAVLTYSATFYFARRNNINPTSFLNSLFSSQQSTLSRNEQNASQEIQTFNALQFAQDTSAKNASDIVKQNIQSVISIRVAQNVSRFSGFGSESAGTGFFASSDGLIVTNRHVVASACGTQSRAIDATSVQVTGLTVDNKAYKLDILSIDPIDDLALLKVRDAGNTTFTPVSFADSEKITLGNDVLAIGNALGEFNNTVTKGIVSGLNRTLETQLQDTCTGRLVVGEGLIQTDAAINQGNSGGPLFDAAGNVVGINTFGASSAQNIGFALPSQTIVDAINSYKEFGKITKPQLGIVSRPLDSALKVQYPWLPSDYGELLYNAGGQSVLPNSGAAKAGLQDGDIILEIDGVKIISDLNGNSPLRRVILSKKPNSTIQITVLKSTGTQNNEYRYEANPRTIAVELGETSLTISNTGLNIR